jgi:HEAT repeat protein
LKDPNPQIRDTAAQALGQTRDSRAAEALIGALDDEDQNVQVAAVRALGQINDLRAVEPLIAAIQGKPEIVRTEAIWVLKKLTEEDFGTDYKRWRQWWLSQSTAGPGASKP